MKTSRKRERRETHRNGKRKREKEGRKEELLQKKKEGRKHTMIVWNYVSQRKRGDITNVLKKEKTTPTPRTVY